MARADSRENPISSTLSPHSTSKTKKTDACAIGPVRWKRGWGVWSGCCPEFGERGGPGARNEPGHIPLGARSVSLRNVAQDANAATPGLD